MAVLAMLGCALLALLLVVSARLYLLLRKRVRPGRSGSVSLLVVAGSGGHTSEILRLLSCLSHAYSPTHYVVAESDTMSEDKICRFEKARAKECCKSSYSIHRIPRSREVLQSWSSSVLTTLHSMFYCLILTFKLRPDVKGFDMQKNILRGWKSHIAPKSLDWIEEMNCLASMEKVIYKRQGKLHFHAKIWDDFLNMY
ncbi:UDP-N-acetylglucosamine transferase subunit ALG14 isoform X2 [Ambystoma mexicanum]|uniref:UDP-N-acetylglucosamine transferase subunit ALG14 isoform X2 n=1 Tax=Ambystoma mexicanum TaxID=8296 RepID=UPI0037E8368D